MCQYAYTNNQVASGRLVLGSPFQHAPDNAVRIHFQIVNLAPKDAFLRSFESITQINIERADFLEHHDARNRLTQPHSGVNGPSNRSGTQALRCCVRG
jgi:hypothetical protein